MPERCCAQPKRCSMSNAAGPGLRACLNGVIVKIPPDIFRKIEGVCRRAAPVCASEPTLRLERGEGGISCWRFVSFFLFFFHEAHQESPRGLESLALHAVASNYAF